LQSPVLLVDSRSPRLCWAAKCPSLLPKLLDHFAEFLQDSSSTLLQCPPEVGI